MDKQKQLLQTAIANNGRKVQRPGQPMQMQQNQPQAQTQMMTLKLQQQAQQAQQQQVWLSDCQADLAPE